MDYFISTAISIVVIILWMLIQKYYIPSKLNQQLEELKGKIAEQQQFIDASLQKSIYVSKIRFDHEFKLYLEIWVILNAARNAAMDLRPELSFSKVGESLEDEKKRKIDMCVEYYTAYIAKLYSCEPFYEKEIFDVFVQIQQDMRIEIIQYRRHTPENRVSYWDDGIDNRQRIAENIDKASDLIRKRFE